MKQKILNFFKPTVGKVFLTLLFLGWQFLYSYSGFRIEIADTPLKYLSSGLGTIYWDSFLIRNASLMLIWLIVAVIIFIGIWFIEKISIYLYNRKVEKEFLNKPKSEYASLLKNQTALLSHIKSRLFLFLGITMLIITLTIVCDFVEVLRYNGLENILISMQESGEMVDFNNTTYMVCSFLALVPFWYIYSSGIVTIFVLDKKNKETEELESEHFAVSVDTKNLKEE